MRPFRRSIDSSGSKISSTGLLARWGFRGDGRFDGWFGLSWLGFVRTHSRIGETNFVSCGGRGRGGGLRCPAIHCYAWLGLRRDLLVARRGRHLEIAGGRLWRHGAVVGFTRLRRCFSDLLWLYLV